MPKEDMLIVEVGRQPKVDGTEKLSALSWLCHHAGQIAKGGMAVIGLLAVGGLAGYFFRGRQSSAASSGNALEVAADVSGALATAATPRSISLIGDAAASKPLDLVYSASAESDSEKIEFGDGAAQQNEDTKTSGADVRAEKPNTATTVGATTTEKVKNNLVVNGTIPDLLLEVGRPWTGLINMTALFGERATLTSFSTKTWPDWLRTMVQPTGYCLKELRAYRVAVSGNLAYVAVRDRGLQIIDITDISRPFQKSEVSGFDASGVTVRGDLAYVVANTPLGFSGLLIVDINDSAHPRIKSNITGHYAQDIAVIGNLAYVASGDGLEIIDVSDSAHPFQKSEISGFDACGVTVRGDLAYVAANTLSGFGGLQIVNISDSAYPYIKSDVTGFYYTHGVAVSGNLAYVATRDYGLLIIDISDSAHPFQKTKVSGFDASGVTVRGDLAYVAAWNNQGLKIIDISDSTHPVLIEPGMPGLYSNSVIVRGNVAYVVSEYSGLTIVDLSQWQLSGLPMQSKYAYKFMISAENFSYGNTTRVFSIKTDNFPYVIGDIPNQSLNLGSCIFFNIKMTSIFSDQDKTDTLFLATNPRLSWLNFTIDPFFTVKKTNFYSSASGITVMGNLVYVATYFEGLRIIDISNSTHPVLNPSVPGLFAWRVTVSDNFAYVASLHARGLQIVNISNSAHPILIKPGVTGFYAVDVTVNGNLAYVAATDQGLKIIDVSNITNPFQKAEVTGFDAYGVFVRDNLAYVAVDTHGNGLQIIDIADSVHPLRKFNVTGFNATGVSVSGNLVYVATTGGLKIIDISDGSNPKLIEPGMSGFNARRVAVSGNLIYVTAGLDGLKIIDVSQPNKPIILGEVSEVVEDVAVLPANTVCMVGDSFSIIDTTNYRFSGTPTNADVGNYPITVTATDPDGAQANTSFTIRVEGGPILNHPIPPQIVLVGEAANFFVTQGTFSDPNKDVITYEAMLAHNKTLPTFLSFNPSSATFSGIPRAEDKKDSPYMVTIFASDRIVYPATPANFILVVQDPIPDQTFVVDRTDSRSLTIPKDSTFEGRSLVYDITLRNGNSLPHWLHFDAPNRNISGTPGGGDFGHLPMQVTLNDTYGQAFFLFNLNVKLNTPPTLTSMMPMQNWKSGENVRIQIQSSTFFDADVEERLTYKADLGEARNWLQFDPSKQLFTGTPSGWTDAYPYVTRKYTITVTATDRSQASASGTFDLNLTGSSWQTLLTTTMAILGTLVTSYGYTQKKYLLWDFFKKDRYMKPRELLEVGNTEFLHKINFPAQRIKSIIVTMSQERPIAQKISPRLKRTLNFFPLLGEAVNDVQTRAFPCASVYLFPWLFYDSKANTLKAVEGGPTAEFIGEDIKIQIRGTDNRIMEEFHIKVGSQRYELEDVALGARMKTIHRTAPQLPVVECQVTAELKQPLIA